MENKDIVVHSCTECSKPFKVYKPAKPGKYPVKCPFCGHENYLEVKPVEVTVRVGKTDNKKGKSEKTVTVPAMIVEESSRGMLVWRKFLIQNRVCLNDGINTIGRKYDGEPTTVAINDKYISRNCAVINVINSDRGTTFQFVVKKTKNPILVSGRQVKVGEIIYLHFGDTIQMGHTVLTFKKVK